VGIHQSRFHTCKLQNYKQSALHRMVSSSSMMMMCLRVLQSYRAQWSVFTLKVRFHGMQRCAACCSLSNGFELTLDIGCFSWRSNRIQVTDRRRAGLPDPNLDILWRALEWKMFAYCHLEYLAAIWYNLRAFGTFCIFFTRFGIIVAINLAALTKSCPFSRNFDPLCPASPW
jgi:hypothetical protein